MKRLFKSLRRITASSLDLIIGIWLLGVIVLAASQAREVGAPVNLHATQVCAEQRGDSKYELVLFSSKGQNTK